jgi:hypothetical protein
MSIDVEALKASVDLVGLVGHYTPLRKRGREYVGLCVAHADKNPSMWVHPEKRIVHCFACDFHADAIDFIQHVEGLDFKAACERLGAKPEWSPKIASAKPEPRPERATMRPPSGAPTPSFALGALGEPQLIFPIRDLDGAILGYECRYAGESGKKEIRVWTWGARGAASRLGLRALQRTAPALWARAPYRTPRRASEHLRRPEESGGRQAPAASVCVHLVDRWRERVAQARLEAARRPQSASWPDADEPGWSNTEKLAALLHDPAASPAACAWSTPIACPKAGMWPTPKTKAGTRSSSSNGQSLERATINRRTPQPSTPLLCPLQGRETLRRPTPSQGSQSSPLSATPRSRPRRTPSRYRRRCPRMRSPRASRTSITAAGAM